MGLLAIKRRMKDYAEVGMRLFWQRFGIFAAASALAAAYYDPWVALFCYALIWGSELYDYKVFKDILAWDDKSPLQARRFLFRIFLSTFFSAVVICVFSISIAVQQGHTTHFMPLFILFSAAVFASMNNHQLVPVLALRLFIYLVAIFFIVTRDIWVVRPPLESELWLQFFIALFVMIFVFECARIFLNFYQTKLRHIEALEREHEKTKIAYKAKSEFLSVVSHELRTPLTSIKASLDLMNAGMLGPVPKQMQTGLDLAQRNSHRLAALINDLLDLQKIDTGRMEFDFHPIDLGRVAREAVEEIRAYAEKFGVSVEFEDHDTEAHVLGDEERIKQVILNLLSNAAKFSGTADTVSVRLERQGPNVRLSVIDRGVGLPDGAHEKVFDAFSQMDSSDQRKAEGTGLGMNISKKIMEAHGGKIDFESREGTGSTFYIELARQDSPYERNPPVAAQ
ncbi:sensor histidine kinase [Roseovarius salinarum]|uniref:sensor histidine kinase n=1 Tax=Roseovarius salinarum TaxID=1981892 RepID=UPI0018E4BE49|nr:HAMP domain-containing sensor histidine kinase [Roseovarius salinarum]